MPQFILTLTTTSKEVRSLLLQSIADVEAASGESIDVTINTKSEANPLEGIAKVQYVATNVAKQLDSAPDSVKALVYGEIVKGTIDGTMITERLLRESYGLNQHSLSGALLKLRKEGFIVSEAIPATAPVVE